MSDAVTSQTWWAGPCQVGFSRPGVGNFFLLVGPQWALIGGENVPSKLCLTDGILLFIEITLKTLEQLMKNEWMAAHSGAAAS